MASTTTATAPPAKKSVTGDKPPTATVRKCNCATVKDGKAFVPGTCTAETKKSFAQGHDARMSARIATAIAKGTMTEDAGVAAIRAAGGGDQLVSKTKWSAALRAKKGNKPATTKICRSCDQPVAKKGDAKNAGLCEQCNEDALDENARADGHDEVSEQEQADAQPVVRTAKIGRWTYKGFVDAKGDFQYKNKRGESMTAVAGSFTVVK